MFQYKVSLNFLTSASFDPFSILLACLSRVDTALGEKFVE